MESTSPTELAAAIKVYREREGDTSKTFNMFVLDEIIRELKQKQTTAKGKK